MDRMKDDALIFDLHRRVTRVHDISSRPAAAIQFKGAECIAHFVQRGHLCNPQFRGLLLPSPRLEFKSEQLAS
jgi:hypothetical protein